MAGPVIKAKRGDTTFVPLVQFEDYEGDVRADITGRAISATAFLGIRTVPVFIDVVDSEQGEVILKLTPSHIGLWTVLVSGLNAEFHIEVERDVT